MNLYKNHIVKNLRKLFISSLFFLFFLILAQSTIITDKVYAGEEGRGCTYDNGETPWLGHACTSEAPFCIDGHCQVKQNDPPGVCGEDDDCTSPNFCEGGTCRSQNDCGSLDINKCKNRSLQCFWYRGGRGDNAECRANQNKGMNCYDGACYSDQQCHRNAMKSDGTTVGFCGNGDLHVNEPCDNPIECSTAENLVCTGNFCKVNPAITPPASTPPPSSGAREISGTVTVTGITPDGTSWGYFIGVYSPDNYQFVGRDISLGTPTGSSAMAGYSLPIDSVTTSTMKIKVDAKRYGSPTTWPASTSETVNTPSSSIVKNYTLNVPGASSSPSPASPTSAPGTSNTCEEVDNRPLSASLADKTFHCKSGCDTGTEEDKTGQGALYACSGALRCCKDKAKYSQYYGSSIGGGTTTTTPAPGGGTSTPGGGTPGPADGPCKGVKGGVLSYVNGTCTRGSCTGPSCLPEEFNAATAATRAYCGGVYKDKYICQNIDPSTSQRYVDYVASGGNTCSSPPWCPATGGTGGGTTTPAPAGPDAGCNAYQGQTCHPGDYSNKTYCCQPSQNLECTNPNPALPNSYTCQYKGGVAFTPTPSASSNCVAGGYGGGIGCKCISGGGCTAGGCYPSAESTNSSDSSHWYCSQGVGTWCERSQTTVPNAAACGTTTPYTSPSPSPTASVPGAYQADCPYYNASGGLTNNECQDGTQCLPGYTHAPIGPGGTNGDRVCSETNRRPNVCCTKVTGGTTTPAPSGTTSTPSPAPSGTTSTPAPTSSYTPPANCIGHPANSMCGSASEANTQCFYPGGTGYWGWKGDAASLGCTTAPNTHCYVCTP